MSIESELLKVSNQKPRGPREDEQKYLTRLILATNDVTESDWDALTKAAQEWMMGITKDGVVIDSGAVGDYEDNRTIRGFPDVAAPEAEEADETESAAEDEDEESDDTPEPDEEADDEPEAAAPAHTAPAAPTPAAAEKPKRKARTPKQPAAEGTAASNGEKRGGSRRIMELLAADVTLTKEAVKTTLDSEGYKITDITLNAEVYRMKNVLRYLSDQNLLKKKITA